MMNLKSSTLGPSNKIFFKVSFRLTIFFFRNKKNFSKEQLLFSSLSIVKQKKIRSDLLKVNWDPIWKILIHHDFDSLGGPLSPCGSHWLR